MLSTMIRIIALGVIAGMRTISAPAFLAGYLYINKPKSLNHSVFRLLSLTPVANLLKVLAGAEFVIDKLPFASARIKPVPLMGRAFSGALTGAAISTVRRTSRVAGALLGALAAIAGAFGAYHARRILTKDVGLPDLIVALVEDVIVIAAGKTVSDHLP